MLTKKDRRYAIKRKKKWDIRGWATKSIMSMSKHHSLNCGCGMCKTKTYFRKYANKQKRLIDKTQLKDSIDFNDC